jgi:hypothetical protein
MEVQAFAIRLGKAFVLKGFDPLLSDLKRVLLVRHTLPQHQLSRHLNLPRQMI